MNNRTTTARWTVDRAVPLLAGFMILVSLALATGLSTWWLLLTAGTGSVRHYLPEKIIAWVSRALGLVVIGFGVGALVNTI